MSSHRKRTAARARLLLALAALGSLLLATLLARASRAPAAPVTVTSPASAPRPGPPDTIIFADGFESGSLSLWQQLPDNGRYRITTTAAHVKSGTGALEVLYSPTNTYGMLTRWFMPGYDTIHVKFDVMFEEGFQNPGMHFVVLAGNRIDDPSSAAGKPGIKPSGADFFYAGLDPEYHPQDLLLRPLHFYTYWPDMTCGPTCYGNRFYQQPVESTASPGRQEASSPRAPLVGGRWQEVVFAIKLNTPGQANGSQTLWVDGVKRIEVQNLRWRTTADLRLNQVRFDNWMAAGTAPKTQHLWVDDVTVWRP